MYEEDTKPITKTLKITMPKSRYDEFVEDCRLNFGDARWLKIVHDSVIQKNMYRIIDLILKEDMESYKFLLTQMKYEIVEEMKKIYRSVN